MSEAKVLICGPIVATAEEADGVWPYTTLEDVISQLEWQKPFTGVRAVINSPGGRLDKGLGIYDYLRSLPGVTITTEAIGQCSSIANAVFLAGSVRLVHPHAESLIHLPAGGIKNANAATAQAWAEDMARAQEQLIGLYVERAGMDATTTAELMSKETVLTAEEMLSYGIATAIVQPATALATLAPKMAQAPSQPQSPEVPASSVMSKLATMATALLATITALGSTRTATTALEVESDKGLLVIDTGDRDTYQVGDKVTAPDSPNDPVADAAYVLPDGNTITVAAELITEIVPTETTTTATTASADGDPVQRQILEAIQGLADVVKGHGESITAMQRKQATTAQRIVQVAAATGSAGVVEVDDVTTTSQQGKTAEVKTGQSAADRRADRQKQNRKL
ncbi:ATP-dependent Clp protease proteolytic subunit [Hymenobacter wooponensis]|uniref:ATP-dependent Clp protease proteolytic subunit n=1 Tax=Hymenobacter wooponensis TaxID=1525360 RepID=A0A4Z0MMA3_9BACT|nr:ATP-dependent Clp protease proteolytic subunit [Hymenobacter wooponensis]TGD80305.1 hypothetical protein EU557_10700 [Hymenobacter wooponensis]